MTGSQSYLIVPSDWVRAIALLKLGSNRNNCSCDTKRHRVLKRKQSSRQRMPTYVPLLFSYLTFGYDATEDT
ncbi:MAG: hypothetical protein SAL70_38875 [Scytonema sp. PMC 1070.18]|nr:hypothetical protein [Scytonema sp. PMC 1070.18]